MLKNIENILERRKKLILRTGDKTGQAKKSFQDFMKHRFGDSVDSVSFKINYNSKNDSLIVTTNSKVLANELIFILADIHEHLKNSGITVSSILVR